MRSMKLRVPKVPGEKRTQFEGLRVGRVGRVGGLGSSLPGPKQQKNGVGDCRGMLRSIFWQRYRVSQCCGTMSRVADQPGHGGHQVTIIKVLCLRSGSVLPHQEIWMQNLLLRRSWRARVGKKDRGLRQY